MDLPGSRPRRGAAWNWLFASGRLGKRCGSNYSRVFDEFPDSPFSGARRRRSRFLVGRGLDAESHFRGDRALFALFAILQPRGARLSIPAAQAYRRPIVEIAD